MKKIVPLSLLMSGLLVLAALFWQQRQVSQTAALDEQLQAIITPNGLTPLAPASPQDPAKVALGQAPDRKSVV